MLLFRFRKWNILDVSFIILINDRLLIFYCKMRLGLCMIYNVLLLRLISYNVGYRVSIFYYIIFIGPCSFKMKIRLRDIYALICLIDVGYRLALFLREILGLILHFFRFEGKIICIILRDLLCGRIFSNIDCFLRRIIRIESSSRLSFVKMYCLVTLPR